MMLALLSARIFTGDVNRPWAEALIIEDNKIVAVGSDAEIRLHIGTKTEVLSLPGRLITAGLVDGHCHFVKQGVLLQQVDLRGHDSLSACREKIRQAVSSALPGDWIIGRGWNHHRWPEKREPSRRDLDDLAPDNPVIMARVCGHSWWVNTPALTIAGISGQRSRPANEKIEIDPHSGEPNGIIRENIDSVLQHIPPLSPHKWRQAALAAQEEALRFGITAVHSCEGLTEWSTISGLADENRLKLRVYHLLHPEDVEAADKNSIDVNRRRKNLWFNRVKLYADGSLGSGTALLHEPYEDDPENTGMPYLTFKQLCEKVEFAYRRGCDVAIHAIGDKAVTNALTAIGKARQIYPGRHRDRIEHVQLFSPADLDTFRELGITASVQPLFLISDRHIATRKWGVHRCRNAYAWKTLKEAGIPLQFGSDSPVEPLNPLLGIQAELRRTEKKYQEKKSWWATDRLTLSDCLLGYTRQPAITSYSENELGTICPGKVADLTVFNKDLFQVPASGLDSVSVELTIIDGKIVYQKRV